MQPQSVGAALRSRRSRTSARNMPFLLLRKLRNDRLPLPLLLLTLYTASFSTAAPGAPNGPANDCNETLALRETFIDRLHTKTVRCTDVCPPRETEPSGLEYCRSNCREYSKCVDVNGTLLFTVAAAARNDRLHNDTFFCRDVCADSAVTTHGGLQYCQMNCKGYRECLQFVEKQRAQHVTTTPSYKTVSRQLPDDLLSTVVSSLTTPSIDGSMSTTTLLLIVLIPLALCCLTAIALVIMRLRQRGQAADRADAEQRNSCEKIDSYELKLIGLEPIGEVGSSSRTSAQSSSTDLSTEPDASPDAEQSGQLAIASSECGYRSPEEEEADTDLKKPLLAEGPTTFDRQTSRTQYSAECTETSTPTDLKQTAIQVDDDDGSMKGELLPTRSGNDSLCHFKDPYSNEACITGPVVGK